MNVPSYLYHLPEDNNLDILTGDVTDWECKEVEKFPSKSNLVLIRSGLSHLVFDP